MKKLHAAMAALVCSLSIVAGEKEVEVLKSTAKELDELVSQKTVAYKEVVRPNFPTLKHKVPPVSLTQIAPSVSARLKIPEGQVKSLLMEDKHRLSDLVMARLLEESGGKPYAESLAQKDPDALIRLVKERQLTTRVKTVLDELYAEVSFAALDAMDKNAAAGAAPGSDQGDAKEKSEKREKSSRKSE